MNSEQQDLDIYDQDQDFFARSAENTVWQRTTDYLENNITLYKIQSLKRWN
jgi:hypothetical protein